MSNTETQHRHFGDQDALKHMVEKQSEGIAISHEVHGTETPGHLWAGADAAREISVVLALLWIFLIRVHVDQATISAVFIVFGLALTLWKCGRSSLLAWSRLERLHRVLEEEKWEIEHHRDQEREELSALYKAKGFEGQLLEDVIDVLMADGDRLLRVMLQEELGFTLESHEHPLKQGLFAGIGALCSLGLALAGIWLWFPYGAFIGCAIAFAAAAATPAWYEKNRIIPAVVRNLAVASLACGLLFFILDYLK